SILALSSASLGPVMAGAKSDPDSSTSRKIVVYQNGVSDETRDHVLGKASTKKVKRFKNSFKADVLENLSEAEMKELKNNPAVLRVDNDAIVTIQASDVRENARGGGSVIIQAQTLPWGISKIKANQVWPSGNTADPVKVGVIDTGISLSHPDIANNVKGSYNAINNRKSANDDNGHGSHVAGIIAALNNTTGVVGAAPKADLYAIKVLNAAGSGYLSDVIEGIDWAISRNIKVINMSLGCDCNIQSLHDAVIRAKNAGVVVVAAAGNSGGAVIYPAAYPEAIAVSATDSNDNLASFSSRGPEVDLSAPGVSIYSTYKGSGYATLSGTSMASPHVAGAAALVLGSHPGYTPEQVLGALESTATDLGSAGFDNLFGFGLVNALLASN
ncbi:MAG: S8 family peptidase, partial [bacterium]|nr:S8 family peptidase [bacterium]